MEKEVWLRDIIQPDIIALLQPVANALLEASEEITTFMVDFPEEKLWEKPADCAAVGFHLKHISGFLDRLFTYAEGNALSDEQFQYLRKEGKNEDQSAEILVNITVQSLKDAIERLKKFSEEQLTEKRYVGRDKIPTTTIGLLFHSAEHTMRHTGQLLVTIALLKSEAFSAKKEN